MKRIFLLLMISYAAIGLALSLTAHLLAMTGHRLGGRGLFFALHAGIFPLWLPVVLVAQRMTRNTTQKDFWKVALSGCPKWMRGMTGGFFAYAVVNFAWFLLTADPRGRRPQGPPIELEWRGFSGHWMAFYSAGLAVMTSALRRGITPPEKRCPNGHALPDGADFCPACGASVPHEL